MVRLFSIAIERVGRQPKVSEEESFDAGAEFADKRPIVEHTFHIVNNKPYLLTIVQQGCTCSCTRTDVTRKVLQPGEATDMRMAVRVPHAYTGKTSVRCEVKFDDGSSKQYTLSYEAFPRIHVDRNIINFETIAATALASGNRQESATVSVDLFAAPDERLPTLASVECPEDFQVDLKESPIVDRVSGLYRKRYTARVTPRMEELRNKPGGTVTEILQFRADNGASTFATLTWRVAAKYTLTPSVVFFGTVAPDTEARTFRSLLASRNDEPIRIASIATDSPDIIVHSEVTENPKLAVLRFSLASKKLQKGGAIAGAVRVILADDDATTLNIPWSAVLRSNDGALRTSGINDPER
jgi:hypothetical protein